MRAFAFLVFTVGVYGQVAPVVQLKPFLSLPLKKATPFTVAEGFLYSPEETAIHGYVVHYAADLECKAGTKLYAPTDGYIAASFQSFYLDREWKGKRVGFGLGNFVQIWVPEQHVYVQIGHLKSVAKSIPFHEPQPADEHGNIAPSKTMSQQTPDLSHGWKKVKRGEYMGEVGTSGLTWGYPEAPGTRTEDEISWDEPHAHVEVFRRLPNGIKDKSQRWDPYGHYRTHEAYAPDRQGPNGLFLADKFGRVQFAR